TEHHRQLGLPPSGRCFRSGFLCRVCNDDHSASAWHQGDAERADAEGSKSAVALANSACRKAGGAEAAKTARQALKPLMRPEMPAGSDLEVVVNGGVSGCGSMI